MLVKVVLHSFLFASLGAITACAQPQPMIDEASTAPLPIASYTEAATSGAYVYRINPEESRILIRVGRAGAMKRLGHDHAVASEDVQGYFELNEDWTTNPSTARADIAFPVRNLTVDKAEYRAEMGLDTSPSESDIAGTYTNMLKVLQPENHAWVVAHAQIEAIDGTSPTLGVSITMNGNSIEFMVPVELEIGRTRLVVSGQTKISQSAFGLVPFSAAGGLLRVADEMDVDFYFVGSPLQKTATRSDLSN